MIIFGSFIAHSYVPVRCGCNLPESALRLNICIITYLVVIHATPIHTYERVWEQEQSLVIKLILLYSQWETPSVFLGEEEKPDVVHCILMRNKNPNSQSMRSECWSAITDELHGLSLGAIPRERPPQHFKYRHKVTSLNWRAIDSWVMYKYVRVLTSENKNMNHSDRCCTVLIMRNY